METEQNNTQIQQRNTSVNMPLSPPPKTNKIVDAMKALKKVTGSWLMLALAITCTVTTLFNVIDMIPKLSGFLLVYYLIKVILAIIICVGVWKIFADGRSNTLNASGFKLVKGVITFRYVIIMLLVALIMVVIIIAMSFASGIGSSIDNISGSQGAVSSKIDASLIIILLVLAAAIAVLVLFFKSVIGSLRSAQTLFEDKIISKNNYYMAAVILIIIGLFKLAIIFATNALSNIAGSVISSIVNGNDSLAGLDSFNGLFGSSWSGILVNICDMLNYVIGGVIIILYAKKIHAIERTMQQNYLELK